MIRVTDYMYVSSDQIARVYGNEEQGAFVDLKSGGTYPLIPKQSSVKDQIWSIAEEIEAKNERGQS